MFLSYSAIRIPQSVWKSRHTMRCSRNFLFAFENGTIIHPSRPSQHGENDLPSGALPTICHPHRGIILITPGASKTCPGQCYNYPIIGEHNIL